METTYSRTQTRPIMQYWSKVKDLDDSLKLELVSMLIESVKPAVARGINGTATLKPYTIEELHQMVAEGERQFAEGQWQDSEDMFRELEEDFAREEMEMTEAV